MKAWRRRALTAAAAAALAVAAITLHALRTYPREGLARYPGSVRILSCDGQPLRVQPGAEGVLCLPVPLDQTGEWTARALVAAEDKRFFRHHGVDPVALARAAVLDVVCRRVVSGASTLSTQVIRLVRPRRRTLATKAIEALQALRMERLLTKSAILEQYLNRAPFGANLVGVEAASRRYFGKAARDLSLGESALLAGLPQSPTRLRPDLHPAEALRRRDYVLRRMQRLGQITPAQRRAAQRPPELVARPRLPFEAPHFCDLVLARGGREGGEIRSTLDPRLQSITDGALARRALDWRRAGIGGGAVVVIDVRTGAVRALSGSPDFFDGGRAGQVNGATARRSPGSALKPFVYAMAFDQGLATPGTVLRDEPRRYRDYDPRNFDGDFQGRVTVRRALVESLNIPALALTEAVGTERFLSRLRALGLTTLQRSPDYYGVSLALGTAEVRLLELADAYACLARLGDYVPCRIAESAPRADAVRLFSAEAAYLVADVLGGEERALAVIGHEADARLPRVALKTGTSTGCRDAWSVAYNPEYVVGVWAGNPDGAPAPALKGIEIAAPLAYEVFRQLYPEGDAPWFARPAGIGARAVCAETGRVPDADCDCTVEDLYIRSVSDSALCACKRAESVNPTALAEPRRRGPRIRRPCDQAQYRLCSFAPGTQAIPLEAGGGAPAEPLYWFVDGAPLATATAGAQLLWTLERGRHVIACSDALGRSDRVTLLVE